LNELRVELSRSAVIKVALILLLPSGRTLALDVGEDSPAVLRIVQIPVVVFYQVGCRAHIGDELELSPAGLTLVVVVCLDNDHYIGIETRVGPLLLPVSTSIQPMNAPGPTHLHRLLELPTKVRISHIPRGVGEAKRLLHDPSATLVMDKPGFTLVAVATGSIIVARIVSVFAAPPLAVQLARRLPHI